MILHKFTSPIGVKCLQDLTIKVTPPHHLNDLCGTNIRSCAFPIW